MVLVSVVLLVLVLVSMVLFILVKMIPRWWTTCPWRLEPMEQSWTCSRTQKWRGFHTLVSFPPPTILPPPQDNSLLSTRLKQFLLPFPVQWGLPTVSAEGVLGMMAGVMVSTFYHAKISKLAQAQFQFLLKRSPILKNSPCIWALTFACTVCCNHQHVI